MKLLVWMGVMMNSFEFKQPISESLFFQKVWIAWGK